jgi:hypothetical protein
VLPKYLLLLLLLLQLLLLLLGGLGHCCWDCRRLDAFGGHSLLLLHCHSLHGRDAGADEQLPCAVTQHNAPDLTPMWYTSSGVSYVYEHREWLVPVVGCPLSSLSCSHLSPSSLPLATAGGKTQSHLPRNPCCTICESQSCLY